MTRPDRPIRSHRQTTRAFDQQENRRRIIEAQVAGAIHLRLDVFDSPPGVGTPRGQGQRTVELFVERQKFGIMVTLELALLSQDFPQHAYRRGRGRCRQIGNDGYFNGFPDKAGLAHSCRLIDNYRATFAVDKIWSGGSSPQITALHRRR